MNEEKLNVMLPPFHQTRTGKSNWMILLMIRELLKGGIVGVAGCKDPKDITDRLKAYGVKAKHKPMISTPHLKPIHNPNSIEGEIIGFEGGEGVQTGYLFYTLQRHINHVTPPPLPFFFDI